MIFALSYVRFHLNITKVRIMGKLIIPKGTRITIFLCGLDMGVLGTLKTNPQGQSSRKFFGQLYLVGHVC